MGGTIYALAGGKGGIGRTTTAVNTGIALERAGYNTVVVDGDVAMTGATQLLDLRAESGVHGILAGTDSINDAVVDGPEGLTFVSGDPSLEAFAEVEAAKLGRVVEPLAAAHDVVLVDTPPGLRPLHRDAYERAAGTVLVTTPDGPAVDCAEKAAAVVDHVGGTVLGAVVTRADEREAAEALDQLDAPPLAVVPEDERVGREPIVAGEETPAAAAFERLAAAIGAHADSGTVEPVSLPDPGTESEEEGGAGRLERVGPEDETTADAGGTLTAVTERLQKDASLDDGEAKRTALALLTERLRREDGRDDAAAESTVDGDEDALDALFEDEYGGDDEPAAGEGTTAVASGRNRLGGLSERVSELGSASAVRERFGRDDTDGEEVELGDDEDPLDALFTDDGS